MATAKNVVVLLLLAVLPLAALASRSGPSSAHKSHGHGHRSSPSAKHPPPPPSSPSSPPSSALPPAPPAAPAAAAAALVRATCNSTAYYDLCVSTLGADPSSATADVRGLSAIAVSVAAANASGGAATAAALAVAATANATGPAGTGTATSTNDDDGTVQALLHTCAAKYGSARDALAAAGDSIALEDYDSASVHVSAAAEYPQVCRALFRRQRPGQYPAELAAREETLKQLCSVALDIVALLISNSS